MGKSRIIQAVKEVLGLDPLQAYRKLVIDLAEDRDVAPEHRQSVLLAACRNEFHCQADVGRFRRLREIQAAKQRLAAIHNELPGAREKHGQAQVAALARLAPINAEYQRQVREVETPVREASTHVQKLEDEVANLRSAISVGPNVSNPELLTKAEALGQQASGLQDKAAQLQRDVARVSTYRADLTTRSLSEAERAEALKAVEKAEATAEDWKAELSEIPGKLARLQAERARLLEEAALPENFRLAERTDDDLRKLWPPEKVYQGMLL